MVQSIPLAAETQRVSSGYSASTGSAASPAKATVPSGAPSLPANIAVPANWLQAAGEGVWSNAGQQLGTKPSMEQTFLLTDPSRPYERVALVWINPAAVRVHVAAGTRHPLSQLIQPRAGQVPVSARPHLLAAFNGGFKQIGGHYSGFGFRAAGLWYRQPSLGLATLAVYPSNHVSLGSLGTDILPAPAPWDLLQNLPLIVNHGRLSTHIDQGAYWGETVGNAVRVWRSGLGITADGALIYAAGEPLTARTLARALILAGAVRAMELDINSYWVTFNFYYPVAPGSAQLRGEKLLPRMTRPATRYLTPDTRPFVYLTAS
ncbi:MAG TPA: hypothetical protein VMV93_02410 [Chloroflexota bacterium]|nr:hypothetical protein [Chloroflexota bacterium]